ncbi:Dipeptidyl aminopeptidase-like protein 6 [Acipenser ruthenus]|uniref:Dipeptidyl aminopeptidase-like protein 6 n=1 Tax=Acipenser ruthenus TaxID=7906 RepID=A0A662YQS6_ACIRT|nr:Dipeptidyl aminopeptidase-like protein 6 [Acipenser ruthenus]
MVTEQYQVDWATVLVSSFSTIVIRFDGHGSGFQGTKLLHTVQRKLGIFEEQGLLQVLSFIAKKPYIDKTRIGAFGEVYGGYLTTLLLTSEDSLLQCGAALSPITDFTLYEKVHFQHTADFISHLISAKANYSLQIYPDEGHFMHNEGIKQHLYQSLVNYFEECFRLPDKLFEEKMEEEEEEEEG